MFSRPSNRPSPPLHRPHPYSLSRPRHLRNRSKPNLPGRHPLVTRPAVRRLLKRRRLKQHLRHHHHWPRLRRSLNRPPPAKPSRNRPKCLRLGSSVPLPRRTPLRHRRASRRVAEGNRPRTSPRDVSPRRVVKAALVKPVQVRGLQVSHPPEHLAHVVPLVRRMPRSRRLRTAARTVARPRAARRRALRPRPVHRSHRSLSRPSSDSRRIGPARHIETVRRSCPTLSRSSPSRSIATSVFNGRALSGTTVPCSKCSSSTGVLTSIDASASPR